MNTNDRSIHRPDPSIQRRHGFTLAELLVVIGIITILIGLLLPMLAKARDAALTTQCMSNMRQQGVAVNQYLAESNGFLPPYRLPNTINSIVQPYIFQYLPAMYQTAGAQTWVCPSDNLLEVLEGGQRGPYAEIYSGKYDIFYSYALNLDLPISSHLIYPGTDTYMNPGLGMKVRQSAGFMFLHETQEDGGQVYNTKAGYFRFNHNRNTAMNTLFMDGHVETTANSALLPNPQWSSSLRTFWFGQDSAPSQMLF